MATRLFVIFLLIILSNYISSLFDFCIVVSATISMLNDGRFVFAYICFVICSWFLCAYWYPTRFQMMLVSFNNSAAWTAYPSGANMLLMDCPPLLAERSTPYTCIWSINISQLIRCSRGCASYHNFLDEGLLVTRKFSIQEFLVVEGITS